MRKLLVLFGLMFVIFACSNDCMNVDVPQKNSNKNNQSNTDEPGKRPTTLQDVVDNANAGDEIDLSDYELTSYTATVNKKLTIKNGSLNNAKLQITAENVKLEKLTDLSVTSSSRLTIKDSKLSNLLIGTSGETSRSTPSSSEMALAMVTVTDSEIENVELNGFNSQLNITDTVTQIDDILISTKAKVILEAGSYDGMKDPTVTNGGEAVRVDMTKDTQLSVLSIYSSPQKLEYNIGDKIDLAGLIVMGTYSTNVETFKTGGWKGESLETITKWEDKKDYTVSSDFNTAGVSIVTVTSTKYPEIKCNFHVFVKDSQSGGTSQPEKEEIEITEIELRSFGTPKTLYKVGEKLDLSCYQVVGKYNGFEVNLPYTSEPANGAVLETEGENIEIKFHYDGGTLTQTIKVTEPYTVEFYDGIDSSKPLYTLEVADGELLKLPVAPNKTGYTFAGWYKADGTKIDAGDEVTRNLTLTAKWNEENAYYVSNTGSDDEGVTGSKDSPFATLQAAVNKVNNINDGTSPYTIYVMDGITGTDSDFTNNNKALINVVPGENKPLNLKICGYNNTDVTIDAQGKGRVMYIGENANVTIENITLTGGNINDNGGGVYVADGATFTMSGGTISGNEADCGGGIYLTGTAQLIMTGGKISGNSAYYGGGVHISGESSKFAMKGGEISGNSAEYGGGVAVDGSFFMSGGTISGNEVTNNSNSNGNGSGSGVYVAYIENSQSAVTFEMSGGAVISLNNDVYLAKEAFIKVTGNLTGTTPVATITPNEYSENRQVLVAGSGVNFTDKIINRFEVTQEDDIEWYVTVNGNLQKIEKDDNGYYFGREPETETNNDGTVVYLMESYDNMLWIARELKTGDITSFNMKLANNIEIPSGKWQFYQLNVDAASTIDGQGHSITINEDVSSFGNDAGGLFYKLNNSTVKNLVLNGSITAKTVDGGYIGALCRSAYGSIFENVMSEVTITDSGSGFAGGLVGYFGGNSNMNEYQPGSFIQNCAVYANIKSTNGTVGGLVGGTWDGVQCWQINNCIYAGTVTGGTNQGVGAIIGTHNTGRKSTFTDTWYYANGTSEIVGKYNNDGNGENFDGYDTVISKNPADIASEAAATLLGDAWEYVSGDYPTLKM